MEENVENMKKVVLVAIFTLGVSMPNVMNAQSSSDKISKLLTVDQKKEYLGHVAYARSCIERAILEKKNDTLCMPYMSQIAPDPFDTVSFMEKGITFRDSIVYVSAHTQVYVYEDENTHIIDSTRINVHYGYLYRKGASGPYKEQFPVFKCEEYEVYVPKEVWRHMRTLTINALKGELVRFAEDFSGSQSKWNEVEMDKYHLTPFRAFSFIFAKTNTQQ